ncbi:MAG: hypothetical protein WD603_01490 [Patescibacteria group bacterium]
MAKAISAKSRKLLWGNSGNRCVMCHIKLVADPTIAGDEHAVLGQEGHIVSHKSDGPRYEPLPDDDVHQYKNRILLCPTHHIEIDNQVKHRTAEELRRLKKKHEEWVDKTLDPIEKAWPPKVNWGKPPQKLKVHKVSTGANLLSYVRAGLSSELRNDAPETKKEAETIGQFFQDVTDYGDIIDELGPGEGVRIGFTLNDHLKKLRNLGYEIYAGNYSRELEINGNRSDWEVCVLLVTKDIQEIMQSA